MSGSYSALKGLLHSSDQEQRERGYFHTAAEIAAQPEVWRKTELRVLSTLPALRAFLQGTERILLSGAGSSHYVGLSVAPLLSERYSAVEAIPSTEILMDPESAFPRSPFILVSVARSGESPEGNAVVELAERRRRDLVRHLAITCNASGSLARLTADLGARGMVLPLPEESNDTSLAMTSSFTSLCLAGASLAYLDRELAYAEIVENLACLGGPLIDRTSDLARELATEGFERAFFLASRPFLGGAFEARLKVQELTAGATITVAEDCLGFRHGPMAGVNEKSLILFALSRDPRRRRYELDLLTEIRAKKLGKRLVVASTDIEGLEGKADAVLDFGATPEIPDALLAIPVAIIGQLLGLFGSLERGLKPDNPSPGGVISRVVQGVRIHPEAEED